MIDQYLGKIHNVECLEFMKQLPDKCVDLVLTDPPYGIDYLSNWADSRSKIYHDDLEAWQTSLPNWLKECSRILTDNGCCCCCCSGGGKTPVSAIFTLEFIKHFNLIQTVIWDKMALGMGWKYRPSYETVVVGSKSKSDYAFYDTSLKVSNIFRCNKIIRKKGDHPTPKPVKLMKHFIKLHTQENDIIFDPFMGSGTTAVAAYQLGRRWFGCEISEEYCDIANKRIKDEMNNLFENVGRR